MSESAIVCSNQAIRRMHDSASGRHRAPRSRRQGPTNGSERAPARQTQTSEYSAVSPHSYDCNACMYVYMRVTHNGDLWVSGRQTYRPRRREIQMRQTPSQARRRGAAPILAWLRTDQIAGPFGHPPAASDKDGAVREEAPELPEPDEEVT